MDDTTDMPTITTAAGARYVEVAIGDAYVVRASRTPWGDQTGWDLTAYDTGATYCGNHNSVFRSGVAGLLGAVASRRNATIEAMPLGPARVAAANAERVALGEEAMRLIGIAFPGCGMMATAAEIERAMAARTA